MKEHVGSEGFTLLGVVVVLLVIGAAAALMPLHFVDITVSKEEQTRLKLVKLVEAVAGIPEERTFGFIGDVGRVPKSLEELNSLSGPHTLCDSAFNPAAPPDFHSADGATNHRGKVGMGWRGPYFKEMAFSDEHLLDAWGQKVRYTCPETTKASTDATTGGVALTLRTGQITSAGPDGDFDTTDDIKAEPFFDKGHLFLTVTQGGADNVAKNVTVTFFFPSNGEQSSQVSAPTTVEAPEGSTTTIVFSSVPAGVRFTQIDFGGAKSELFHMGLKSNIANRINVKIPVGPGGKP